MPRAGQVGLGLLGDVARVAGVGLAGERVVDEEVQRQRLLAAERVDERRRRVGQQQHVRLVDLLEAADRRAVERETVGEDVSSNDSTGTVKCCITPGRSQKRTSTNLTPSSLMYRRSSSALVNTHPPRTRSGISCCATVWLRRCPAMSRLFRPCFARPDPIGALPPACGNAHSMPVAPDGDARDFGRLPPHDAPPPASAAGSPACSSTGSCACWSPACSGRSTGAYGPSWC